MIPVVELLQNEKNHGDRFSGALVHIISSGGGWQFMPSEVYSPSFGFRVLHQGEHRRLLFSIPCLMTRVSNPPSAQFPRRIPSFVCSSCTPLCVYLHYNRYTGRRPLFAELREAVLQPDIPPSISSGAAPRLYVYSQSNTLVLAERVEKHIAAAAQLRLDVAVEEFEGTGHAAYMNSDPKRYWSAVHSVWVGAVVRLGPVPR